MNSWRNIYKLHDKLINLLVIVVLSVLCMAFDKLTTVNLALLNFKKAQYFLDSYHTKLNIYYHGYIKYTIAADHMKFMSDINQINCLNCKFSQYDELSHKISMVLVGDKAKYDIDQQIMVADGHLKLSTFSANDKDNVEAFTDHIVIKTDSNTAHGDSYINIIQGENNLSGTGFDINYDTKIMTINSHVKLNYKKGSKN